MLRAIAYLDESRGDPTWARAQAIDGAAVGFFVGDLSYPRPEDEPRSA
jgi:hypothetical protein